MTVASQIVTQGDLSEISSSYVKIPVQEQISTIPLRHIYYMENGIIDGIQVDFTGNSTTYWLPSFLVDYGEPDEIWISTFSRPQSDGGLILTVRLFYKQGILIEYQDLTAEVKGDHIRGCPQEHRFARIWLWAENGVTFTKVINKLKSEVPYRPLQEATEMDVETFYTTFKNPKNTTCLETPADLWPDF